MRSNDSARTAQHPEPIKYLPVHVPRQPQPHKPSQKPSRVAVLRARWTTAWAQGGVLYRRWDEVFQARHAGWHGMANWIKATLALTALGSVIVLLDTASDVVATVLHALFTALSDAQPPGTDATRGLWGVIDNPVRSYIDQHSAGLTVPASAVYAFWQAAGLLAFIGGFTGSAGARIAWALWGGSSAAMVWAAAPVGGRVVATGLAALMWALASIVALRGLSLRPVIHNHPVFQPQLRPELHLHATIPAPAAPADADFHDEPDNVHPFQR